MSRRKYYGTSSSRPSPFLDCRLTSWLVGRRSTSPGVKPRTFAAPEAHAFRPNPSGKRPLGETAAICFPGDRILQPRNSRYTGSNRPVIFLSWLRWIPGKKAGVPMACIIWRGTRPNGSKIGSGSITMRPCPTAIRADRLKVGTRLCAAVHGRARRSYCGARRGAGRNPSTGPLPSASVAPGRFNKKSSSFVKDHDAKNNEVGYPGSGAQGFSAIPMRPATVYICIIACQKFLAMPT